MLVDGTLREGVVIRIRGDRFYVKHETDGSLYTCAWFDQSVLCAPACSGAH